MATYRQSEAQQHLDWALEDIAAVTCDVEASELRDELRKAWNEFYKRHKDAPWAGAMLDNYKREVQKHITI